MPATATRQRIERAANTLFYRFGIKATSLDAIASKAGVTKRTIYYHFASKDDLVAGYLISRDQPNLRAFQDWFASTPGDLGDKVAALFEGVARAVGHPRWRGCGFQRTAGELANQPGHPAIRAASRHKRRVEDWLAEAFARQGLMQPARVARQVAVLLEGALATMLIHRDLDYVRQAGQAARALIGVARS